jgi:hypothetical protein
VPTSLDTPCGRATPSFRSAARSLLTSALIAVSTDGGVRVPQMASISWVFDTGCVRRVPRNANSNRPWRPPNAASVSTRPFRSTVTRPHK